MCPRLILSFLFFPRNFETILESSFTTWRVLCFPKISSTCWRCRSSKHCRQRGLAGGFPCGRTRPACRCSPIRVVRRTSAPENVLPLHQGTARRTDDSRSLMLRAVEFRRFAFSRLDLDGGSRAGATPGHKSRPTHPGAAAADDRQLQQRRSWLHALRAERPNHCHKSFNGKPKATAF